MGDSMANEGRIFEGGGVGATCNFEVAYTMVGSTMQGKAGKAMMDIKEMLQLLMDESNKEL
jgi:hypothetical protein